MRFLLAFLCFLPTTILAQDTLCSELEIDLDGDLLIGAGDILVLLGSYGSNLDVDGDMIPDCIDDCVGGYDTCGVCNGPGPQVLAIDTIVISYDSLFVEASGEWQVFELERDTILHLVCENPGCTDSLAINFDPYATEDGSCVYEETDCTVQFMMFDTNGNGWDGTTYTLTNSEGAVLASGSLDDAQFGAGAEGSQGYDLFCLPFNGCYTLELTGGSFPGEKEWQIIDYNTGGVLYDQTNNNGYGVFDVNQPGVICGCTNSDAINYDAEATDDGSCVFCDNGQLGLYLTLQDDFGTGWSPGNDYYVVSEETGDTVLTGTLAPGPTTATAINCLDIGCYTFSTGAIFTSEGWGIADNLGNQYAPLTYGPTNGYPIAFGGMDVTDCAFPGCTDSQANNYNISASVDDSTCDFPPPNDSYVNAQAIACDLILTGSLQNANGDEYNGTTVLGNGISNSGAIWYEFNADQDYQVTFNTCASADADNGVTDTDVIVFAVGTDGSLTAIATNDDSGIAGCGSGTTGTFNSIVSINAEQGNNYLVRVGHYSSFSSQTGIAIEANCAPIVSGGMDPAYAE